MENTKKQKITLDQPVTYQIQIPGHVEENWLDWYGDITIDTRSDESGFPVTIMVGTFDQAALIGLLRRLYSLGLPLISVIWVEFEQNRINGHLPPHHNKRFKEKYHV